MYIVTYPCIICRLRRHTKKRWLTHFRSVYRESTITCVNVGQIQVCEERSCPTCHSMRYLSFFAALRISLATPRFFAALGMTVGTLSRTTQTLTVLAGNVTIGARMYFIDGD